MRWFWASASASIAFRIVLIYFSGDFSLGSRPEIASPVTSIRRLAEGYWLKQLSMSPYSGSMYHGSPLLLPILGPLAVKRIEGKPSHFLCSCMFVIVDFIAAFLIRAIGQKLQSTSYQSLRMLELSTPIEILRRTDVGDIGSLIFLWNPFTIMTCVGSSTSPIDNFMVLLSLYGACFGMVPLAAFGWVFAAHLSLYPVILVVPLLLLLGYGPDVPPSKLYNRKPISSESHSSNYKDDEAVSLNRNVINCFSWKPVIHFAFWASIWAAYIIILSIISLKDHGSLSEMFSKTYGFILTVEDLSPNIGILWYFFAEVFVFFRNFFLIVFHVNILFMVLPLAISLKHRPCFLTFVYIAISSMLKSYPSVGDSALFLGLVGLFINELAAMQFSFFLFCGFIGVSLLSPVMHNLWIWRGTGNANFYFATGIAYACLQTILIVESVSTMLKHDRFLRKPSET